MAFEMTNDALQRIQELQRLHQTQQLQQAAALQQPQNNAAARRAARATQGSRRRQERPIKDPAAVRMITEVGPQNRQNRRGFKAWYRVHKQTMRFGLLQDSSRMSADVARYGVSRPEWFITVSSGDQLRDFIQVLTVAQKLALFDLAMARQEEKGDVSDDKVAVFNTINGRPGDMPLAA